MAHCNPSRAEQRRKKAFQYFLHLNEQGYRYHTSIEKAAKKFFYSPLTLEQIIYQQRRKNMSPKNTLQPPNE